MRVLVVNSGSSSLKLRVLDDKDEVLFARDLPATAGIFDHNELTEALSEVHEIDAVGHRIVHGGAAFRESVLIDEKVEAQMRALADLAPLHQAQSLTALDSVSQALPELPAVACFDTAFHASLPPAAATYPIPSAWRDRHGIRRYGFHGLSHSYAARRAAELVQQTPDNLRIVSCHLGAGASLAAVRGGVSVDTTMGFTPLEGVVMSTRSGTVDPGLVLWLQQHAGLSVEEVAEGLEHRSGLKGLAGNSDMREVLAAAASGEPAARLAVDVYVHRLSAGVAAMAASLGGVDVLLFTGGVGENAWAIRARAAERLAFLGVEVASERNELTRTDLDISTPGARVRTLVVTSREEVEIARDTRRLAGSARPKPPG